MKVAIIGAGIAGLASARRAQQYNLECTVFEVTGNVGGTWVYTENPFADEFNNPVLSSLYASTRTITPVQAFQLEGLEFKPKSGLSYPGHEEVLEYFQNYSKKYNLQQYIKFYNKVLKISRETNVWKLDVQNVKENTYTDYLFDAVLLCNGRSSKPKLPQIRGMETFPGDQIHSHYYRRKDSYKDKHLLIVGAGNSAQDISTECSKIAKKVYLSYRTPPNTRLEENIELKKQISSIDGCRIQFEDNTYIDVDSIIYCTGYEYDTSLLDPSCGIEILEDQILKPLFKMFINANLPTIAIMGLQRSSLMVKLFDLQAEVYMKYLEGLICLPSTEDMLKSFNDEYNRRRDRGAKYYYLERETKEYYNDLAQMANLEPLPLVLWNLCLHLRNTRKNCFATFRNQAIKIIDGENFEFEEIHINDTRSEIKTRNQNAESKSKS